MNESIRHVAIPSIGSYIIIPENQMSHKYWKRISQSNNQPQTQHQPQFFPTMFSSSSSDHFVWKENSKIMHDKVIEATPYLFRYFTRSGIDGGLAKHGCGDVTEAIMYDVVKEVTPKAHLEASLKILDEYKTPTPPSTSS